VVQSIPSTRLKDYADIAHGRLEVIEYHAPGRRPFGSDRLRRSRNPRSELAESHLAWMERERYTLHVYSDGPKTTRTERLSCAILAKLALELHMHMPRSSPKHTRHRTFSCNSNGGHTAEIWKAACLVSRKALFPVEILGMLNPILAVGDAGG
jgi:hypothetical protein